MIKFSISQMGALVLYDKIDLSQVVKSQIMNAHSKADVWHINCKKDELFSIHQQLIEKIISNNKASSLDLALKEIEIIAKRYV